jgi:hypothetical protein
VAKTVSMRSARRLSQAKKLATAKAKPPPVSFFLNHGRAWINGDEVGGSDPRYAHLNRSYD